MSAKSDAFETAVTDYSRARIALDAAPGGGTSSFVVLQEEGAAAWLGDPGAEDQPNSVLQTLSPNVLPIGWSRIGRAVAAQG